LDVNAWGDSRPRAKENVTGGEKKLRTGESGRERLRGEAMSVSGASE